MRFVVIEENWADEFVHPGDVMDAKDAQEGPDTRDLFKRLLVMCLPEVSHYGGARRFEAAHRRMCVLMYFIAPEFFKDMSKKELARMLGITYRALMMEFEHVREMVQELQSERVIRPAKYRQK